MRIPKCLLVTGCLILMTWALVGCGIGNAPEFRTDTRRTADGTTIDRTVGNEIAVTKESRFSIMSGVNSFVHLDAERCRGGEGSVTYSLLSTIRYSGSVSAQYRNPRYVAETLTLTIDGEPIVLPKKGEISRDYDDLSRTATESRSYPISAEILRDLANAKEVDVEISCHLGRLKGSLTNGNMANFKRFYEKYGSTTDQPATQER